MADQSELIVEVIDGIISNTKADVLVNSTNRDLKIDLGALSKSILAGAGQELQAECNQNYPKGLQWGEIAVTGGYGLSCKKVYHGVLPAWDTEERGVNPKKCLLELVNTCLSRANADGMTSIAFPTLGCGFLNYPHDEVAMAMCECIALFKSQQADTPLRQIYIVIYNKGQDWRHIKQAFCTKLGLELTQQNQTLGATLSSAISGALRGTLWARPKKQPIRDIRARDNPKSAIESPKRLADEDNQGPKKSEGDPGLLRVRAGPDGVVRPKRISDPLLDTCRREQAHNACKNILRCGHVCCGVKNERSCPPCLQKGCPGRGGLTQTADENCIICYTDVLSAAPVIKLACGHVYHMHCVKRVLDNRWVGARITFSFMNCPLCKKPVSHPMLADKMAPLMALRDDVCRKALMRLQYEGLSNSAEIRSGNSPYCGKPEQFAMDRYCYYLCCKCKEAYFGGLSQCEQGAGETDFRHEELVCPACSNPDPKQVCAEHGTSFLEYKCRYCCSVAVFFCFGTTHFCNECHDLHGLMTNMPAGRLPNCPAGPGGKQLVGKCPLNVKHPAAGTEFSLGCGICKNTQSF